MMIAKTTNGVTIRVMTKYLAQQSRPEDQQFNYGYHVTITNERSEPVKLISRFWKIKSAGAPTKVVEGEGVIGQQPIIGPNSSYQYNSWCPLTSRFGAMKGYYVMEDQITGEVIEVEIPEFELVFPPVLN